MKSETALYYYPTNIVLIDDNETFLSSLRQALQIKSPHLYYDTYSNPLKALEKVNENYTKLLQQHSVSLDSDQEHASQFVFDILNKGNQIKTNRNRSDEISVLVVDLDMPGIDGIELCKQITSPNIKKILLTGVTATDRVIDAFNNADIHFYISKSEEDMDSLLEQAIARLQYEYFSDISSKVKADAIAGSKTLLSDSVFAQYFSGLRTSLGIKEFYFEPYPTRYNLELLDNSKGLLLVYSEEELQEQIAVLKEEEAPETLINAIQAGEVPYFTTADGFYEAQHPDVNRWTTYPANVIQGKQRYYCALLRDSNIPQKKHYIFPLSNKSVH